MIPVPWGPIIFPALVLHWLIAVKITSLVGSVKLAPQLTKTDSTNCFTCCLSCSSVTGWLRSVANSLLALSKQVNSWSLTNSGVTCSVGTSGALYVWVIERVYDIRYIKPYPLSIG